MIQLIYAYCATNSVDGKLEYAFGLNGGLPWGHIKQDMKNFAYRTQNTTLIMGAKTFASIDAPLAGRRHIVVQDMKRPHVTTKCDFYADEYISEEDFLLFLSNSLANNIEDRFKSPTFSIIGGAHILKLALPYADRIIQTSIQKKHRINSDVQLDKAFINYPGYSNSYRLVNTQWTVCDELTTITESVYDKRV